MPRASRSPAYRPARPAAVRRAAVEGLEARKLLSVSLVSAASNGATPDATAGIGQVSSVTSAISDDGRYVAFVSRATNLVSGDANGTADVFVRDTATGALRLVSRTPAGASGNGASGEAAGADNNGIAISGDGRYVVFVSEASDLVANDANGGADLFVHDLQANTTALVTVDAAGTGSGSNGGGATAERVWGRPAVSDDGRFIAFSSDANNLAAGQEDDGLQPDTFVRDTVAGTTTQLTKPASGAGDGAGSVSQSMSADGRFVAFVSADTLIAGKSGPDAQVYVYDTTSKATTLVSAAADGTSRGAGGDSRNPRISGDGRHVTFQSAATNLVPGYVQSPNFRGDYDLFHRQLFDNTTRLVSRQAGTDFNGANDTTGPGAISRDGRYIAFYSSAGDLVADQGDANGADDAFLFDTSTGSLGVLSLTAAGGATAQRGAGSAFDEPPALSEDGRVVVFASTSDDIVANDLNAISDLFAVDRITGAVRRIIADLPTAGGAQAQSNVDAPAISADGSRVAFAADGFGLPGSPNGTNGSQIYLEVTTPGQVDNGGNEEDPVGVDLTPSVASFKLPAAVVGGQRASGTMTVEVTNRGTEALNGPVTVTVYATTGGTATQGNAEVAAVTKRLKLGSLSTKALRVKVRGFPAVADGSYLLVAVVTPGAGVTDVVADNNQAVVGQPVIIAAPFVDLAGAATVAPRPARAGRSATMVLDVTNAGNVVAAGTTAVRVTIAPAAGGETASVDVPLKVKLKPGQTKRAKLKFALPPAFAAGQYVLTAAIDPQNAIVEPNEANNAAGPVPLTVVG